MKRHISLGIIILLLTISQLNLVLSNPIDNDNDLIETDFDYDFNLETETDESDKEIEESIIQTENVLGNLSQKLKDRKDDMEIITAIKESVNQLHQEQEENNQNNHHMPKDVIIAKNLIGYSALEEIEEGLESDQFFDLTNSGSAGGVATVSVGNNSNGVGKNTKTSSSAISKKEMKRQKFIEENKKDLESMIKKEKNWLKQTRQNLKKEYEESKINASQIIQQEYLNEKNKSNDNNVFEQNEEIPIRRIDELFYEKEIKEKINDKSILQTAIDDIIDSNLLNKSDNNMLIKSPTTKPKSVEELIDFNLQQQSNNNNVNDIPIFDYDATTNVNDSDALDDIERILNNEDKLNDINDIGLSRLFNKLELGNNEYRNSQLSQVGLTQRDEEYIESFENNYQEHIQQDQNNQEQIELQELENILNQGEQLTQTLNQQSQLLKSLTENNNQNNKDDQEEKQEQKQINNNNNNYKIDELEEQKIEEDEESQTISFWKQIVFSTIVVLIILFILFCAQIDIFSYFNQRIRAKHPYYIDDEAQQSLIH